LFDLNREQDGPRCMVNGNIVADATRAGLRYLSDEAPGIRRVARGKGFAFVDPGGSTIRDSDTRRRIRRLAVPPAWTDVWISPDPDGHIQATGRDARGRKQYRYHPDFMKKRNETKYERILDFAEALPRIRRRVIKDMSLKGLPWEKVVATVVYLLDTTLIRIGNADYARQNGSFGLTTLRDRHVSFDDNALRFEFKGKSGKVWRVKLRDRRAARIVKSCQDLPGQHLFQFVDAEDNRRPVGSADVNRWLRAVSGRDITAKDFRTWGGTVLAAMSLAAYDATSLKTAAMANIREAIEKVAHRLGNTPAICRKCYVHPAVIDTYLESGEVASVRSPNNTAGASGLTAEEKAVLALLRACLQSKSGIKPHKHSVKRATALRRASRARTSGTQVSARG
jgi:DNA topoisomerase-1